jgi:4-amino-4-deoxy-L-arabinose transferase-like glycosyltransferase
MERKPGPSFIQHPSSLFLILLMAFLLRAGWGLRQPAADQLGALPDQVEYLQLAQNLIHRHQFSFYDSRPNIQERVRAYRTPGYPLFLAACGASVRVARLAQAFIGALTALAAYLLARHWLSNNAALLAALLVAVNPFLIYFSGLILSETLYTGMLAWALVLLMRSNEATKRRRRESGKENPLVSSPLLRRFVASSLLSGLLLLALGILVRPSGLFLPILMGAGTIFLNWRADRTYHWARESEMSGGAKRPLLFLAPVAGAVLTILVLLPWAARNHRVLRQWIWTTTNGGITLYDGFNPDATGASDQTFLQRMPQVRFPRMNEMERSTYFGDLARHWAREHPVQSLQLAAVKVARTWSPVPLSREYGGRKLYVLAGALFAIPLDLLVLLGLIARGLPWRAKVFLLLPAIYFTVVHGMTVGSLRYRMPMAPLLAVLAACGMAMIWDRCLYRKAKAALP